jgi:hypothetical protein
MAGEAEEGKTSSQEEGQPQAGQIEEKVEGETQQPDTQVDEDREPGGDDPQAVRARKEYRARKRLETQYAEEERRRLIAETELRTLREAQRQQAQQQQQQDKPQKFTPQQVQAALDAGKISFAEASDYLAKLRAEETAEKYLKQERERNDSETRTARANASIDAYIKAAPWLTDKSDPRRTQLEDEHRKLTDPYGIYRLPEGPTVDLMVLERVLGPVDKLKGRADVSRFSREHSPTHSESGARGAGTGSGDAGGKGLLDKMPKHFHDFWERTGTSQAEREKEAKIYFARRGSQK